MEKIGIIGTGNMGRTLGTRLAQLGYPVFFGARDARRAQLAADDVAHDSKSGNIDSAAEFGDVLIWTMREFDPSKVLAETRHLGEKIIIDLNNRDYAVEARTGVWFEKSIAEQLQANLPSSHVVKAFNTMAMEAFATEPNQLRSIGAQTFLAGADGDAKRRVAVIAADLGFEAIDLGQSLAAFRAAEAMGDVIRLLMIDGKRGGAAHLHLIELPPPTIKGVGQRAESKYA